MDDDHTWAEALHQPLHRLDDPTGRIAMMATFLAVFLPIILIAIESFAVWELKLGAP